MATLRVSVNRLREGMTIKNDVYSRMGMIVVSEGTPVNKEVVNLLTRHFIDTVMVEYTKEEMSTESQKTAKTKEEHYQEMKKSFQIAEETISEKLKEIASGTRGVEVPFLLNTLNGIIKKSAGDGNLIEMMARMKEDTESLYTHAINVGLLAQMLAKWVNCTQAEQERATVAGILHDIGILEIPKGKRENFTYHDEMETGIYEKHVIYGYNMIKDQDIDQDIKQAVLSHHERIDGRGYPLRIKGANISKLGKIVAIADAYDTLTMASYGEEKLSVFEALNKMESDGFRKYDSQLLIVFMTYIAESTIQSKVLLSDGSQGQIVMVNRNDVCNPVVKVNDAFVDLSKNKNLSIKELL